MNESPQNIYFRPAARTDLHEAYDWYERQRRGLGRECVLAMARALEQARTNPGAFAVLRGDVRRVLVDRFPYGIYFFVQANDLIVVAVMHSKRHPRRWQGRE